MMNLNIRTPTKIHSLFLKYLDFSKKACIVSFYGKFASRKMGSIYFRDSVLFTLNEYASRTDKTTDMSH